MADPNTFFVEGRNKNELLNSLLKDSVGVPIFEQQRMGIIVRCTEDLEAVIKRHQESNDRLSNRILWLNIILGAFTIIGTCIAIYQFFK